MSAGRALTPWRISGSYFEACNCEAICPCRSQGGRTGGRPTFGVCDFALSWRILDGRAASLDLSGLAVVLAGSFEDDEPGSPWRVAFYLDERADEDQKYALTEIFLGRTGGTTLRNFARQIGEVYAVRPARIELDHGPNDHLRERELTRLESTGRRCRRTESAQRLGGSRPTHTEFVAPHGAMLGHQAGRDALATRCCPRAAAVSVSRAMGCDGPSVQREADPDIVLYSTSRRAVSRIDEDEAANSPAITSMGPRAKRSRPRHRQPVRLHSPALTAALPARAYARGDRFDKGVRNDER